MSKNEIDASGSMKLVEKFMVIVEESDADDMEQFIANCYLLSKIKRKLMSLKDVDSSKINGFDAHVGELINAFLIKI